MHRNAKAFSVSVAHISEIQCDLPEMAYWGNATAQKMGKCFPCTHQLLAVDKYTT